MDALSDLAFFSLVVKHGNLSAAARELGLTPPAVSTRLAKLEQRLGVRLLTRTTRRVSVTVKASSIWPRAGASWRISKPWNARCPAPGRNRRACCG